MRFPSAYLSTTEALNRLVQINPLILATGDLAGFSYVHKFGEASDIDTGDGFVDIWDGAGDANADKTYTFSTTADIDSLSSSNNGDTQTIEVHGLDSNWDLVVQEITLTGQTRVALSTDLIRVFRMVNTGTTDFAGNVYCYVNGAITAGVPNTSADIRAIVVGDNNQTLMAIYTIPNGKVGYLSEWWASISKKEEGTSDVHLKFRPFGGVFQLKHSSSITMTGTSYVQHDHTIPKTLAAKTDIIMMADTSINNSGVSAGFDILLVDD